VELSQNIENRQTAICFAGLDTYNGILDGLYDMLRYTRYLEQRYILASAMALIFQLRNQEIGNESDLEK
jgi:hypothetical protein